MTNALVLIEACSICGLVQRTYLGRQSSRKTPLVCASCSRPWIQWECPKCGAANHEQVAVLPKRSAHSGLCCACGSGVDTVAWARSSRRQAQDEKERGSGSRAGQVG